MPGMLVGKAFTKRQEFGLMICLMICPMICKMLCESAGGDRIKSAGWRVNI
jgi:hypothetical protein